MTGNVRGRRCAVLAASSRCARRAGFAGPASAQTYPSKTMRLIVPFAAGGPTDVIAPRGRAEAVAKLRAAGRGRERRRAPAAIPASRMVAKRRADGYTMLVVITGFIVNPSLYAKVPYDPIKDFAPVTLVAASPNVIVGQSSVPAKSLKELIELIKANPGQVQLRAARHRLDAASRRRAVQAASSASISSMVPFTGAALAINSTLGGHTPIALHGAAARDDQHPRGQAARARAARDQALAGAARCADQAEAGVPDHECDTLTGIVAPAGTPQGDRSTAGTTISPKRRAARGQSSGWRARLRADRRHAGRIRRADEDRDGEVGQGRA